MTHALKTWPVYFKAVKSGQKKFEIRKADRPFKVGDRLLLQEFDNETSTYSGDEMEFAITCMVDTFGVKKGYVILGIEEIVG